MLHTIADGEIGLKPTINKLGGNWELGKLVCKRNKG